MSVKSWKVLSLVTASTLALGGYAPASAQALDEESLVTRSGQLEEIIVTATRRATNLQDTPLAITAVTAQDLENRSISSIQDVAAVVPNASFKKSPAYFGPSVTAFIRGIGQFDSSLAFEPGVAFYVDDQYYALLSGSVFDLLDLERVEVLRGPQGTTFGRGAIGGAVNLIPKAPDGNPSGYGGVTFGAYNRVDLRGGFNLPLSDNLFMRISGVSKSRKGYQKLLDFPCDMARKGTPELAGTLPTTDPLGVGDCVIDTYGGEDVHAIRGALRYEGNGIDLTISADVTDDKSKVAADSQIAIFETAQYAALSDQVFEPLFGVRYDDRFLTSSIYETYRTYADPVSAGSRFPVGCGGSSGVPCGYYDGSVGHGGWNTDRVAGVLNWGVAGKLKIDLATGLDMVLNAGYRDVKTKSLQDSDGSPLNIQTIYGGLHHKQYTVEPRLNYNSDFLSLVVGGFYYKGDTTTGGTGGVSLPFLPFYSNDRGAVHAESKAGYAQAVVHPMKSLGITFGARYTHDNKQLLNTLDVNGVPDNTLEFSAGRFDWRLGVDYQVTPDITVYASAASGYRPGAFNNVAFQPTQRFAVEGEEAIAYEIGLKGDFFDRRLRANIAGFYTDYKKRITLADGLDCIDSGIDNQCVVPGDLTQVKLDYGYQTCLPYDPTRDGPRNVLAGIGVTCLPFTNYLNTPAKIKGIEIELEARPIDNLLVTFSGGYTDFDAPELERIPIIVNKSPTFVPKWTASGGIQYMIVADGINGSITPRLDWFYQSKIFNSSTSLLAVTPGRSVFNGRLTYDNNKYDFSIAVGATNLFNKKYFHNTFDLVGIGQGTVQGQPAAPREWYLQISKRF